MPIVTSAAGTFPLAAIRQNKRKKLSTVAPSRRSLASSSVGQTIMHVTRRVLRHGHNTSGLILLNVPQHKMPLTEHVTTTVSNVRNHRIPTNTLSIKVCHSSLQLQPAITLRPAIVPNKSVANGAIILISSILFDNHAAHTTVSTLSNTKQPETIRLTILISQKRHSLPVHTSCINGGLPASHSSSIRIALARASKASTIHLIHTKKG